MGKINCDICKRKCKGDVLKLDQKFIHKDCFNCHECASNLSKGGFFQRNGQYFCWRDYQRLFGVKCSICNQFADGEVVKILGSTFHLQCFKCDSCSHSFNCGDKATLWDGHYVCDLCANQRIEQQNISPSWSDFIVPTPEKPIESGIIVSETAVAVPYTDSSDTDGPTKPQDYLQLHIENGYTSTDSGVEKTKSEFGCLSPCYSTSSGDESWMKSCKTRKSKPLNYFQFGKCLNQSYLTIEKQTSARIPEKSRYRGMAKTIGYESRKDHFHRQTNFSYRSQQNINSKKGMSLLISPFHHSNVKSRSISPSQSTSMRLKGTSHRDSHTTMNLTEEVKRLAHFPDGREPDSTYDPPIDRYDFPAPAFTNLIMRDFKRGRPADIQRTVVSTGDIFVDTLSGTDTAIDSTDFPESDNDRVRTEKIERRIQVLKKTERYSGLSKSVLEEYETKTDGMGEGMIDPVSSSRSPDASFEPLYKTRYDRHSFTSPSRDCRYEARHVHKLQSKMQYSSTGGRAGYLSGYTSNIENESGAPSTRSHRYSGYPAPLPGYTQGYMSCGEGPLKRRPTSNCSDMTSSLPRPLKSNQTKVFEEQSEFVMNGRMTQSMTTSGYSVDATTRSIDESTLIGGSGILSSKVQRDGYMSDVAHISGATLSERTKPEWYYEANNEELLFTNYLTVQSFLKPSNDYKLSGKIPVRILPYEKLKISNVSLQKGLDRTKLEIYLSDTDFQMVFQMTIAAFNRLPEWKRNDLKRKMDLY